MIYHYTERRNVEYLPAEMLGESTAIDSECTEQTARTPPETSRRANYFLLEINTFTDMTKITRVCFCTLSVGLSFSFCPTTADIDSFCSDLITK